MPQSSFYSFYFLKEVTKGKNIFCILDRTYIPFIAVSYNFMCYEFIISKAAESNKRSGKVEEGDERG